MKVVLFVNSACNAACSHCYINYSGARSPENTLETVKHLQNQGHDVVIAGSETLLEPGYLASYQQAGQKHILSNGILLDKNKFFYTLIRAHGIEELVFSVHFGVERDLKSVPKNLVARVIRETKTKGFKLKIFTVITSKNYRDLFYMCEQAIYYKADVLELLRFVGCTPPGFTLTPQKLQAFFLQIEQARKKYPKSILDIKPRGNFGPRPGSKGEALAKQNKYCPIGTDQVIITPDNSLYGCPFVMQKENRLGVYEDGKIKIEKDLLDGKRDTCIAHLLT